jgi:selT/selW/selH-like putative selenoprotein
LTVGQDPCGTGAFEVSVNGQLIHSKLTMGHGKCQTEEELDNILDKVRALTG